MHLNFYPKFMLSIFSHSSLTTVHSHIAWKSNITGAKIYLQKQRNSSTPKWYSCSASTSPVLVIWADHITWFSLWFYWTETTSELSQTHFECHQSIQVLYLHQHLNSCWIINEMYKIGTKMELPVNKLPKI